jgi:hypothetical protein
LLLCTSGWLSCLGSYQSSSCCFVVPHENMENENEFLYAEGGSNDVSGPRYSVRFRLYAQIRHVSQLRDV